MSTDTGTDGQSAREAATEAALQRAHGLIFSRDRPEEGLELVNSVGRWTESNGHAQALRLAALAKLGLQDAFDRLLARMLGNRDFEGRAFATCTRLANQGTLPVTPCTMELLYGAPGRTLWEALQAPRCVPLNPAQRAGFAASLRTLPRDDVEAMDELLERFDIGRARFVLVEFLMRIVEESRDEAARAHFADPDLQSALNALLLWPDMSAFERLNETGETAVVLSVHAGMATFTHTCLDSLAVPQSVITTDDSITSDTFEDLRTGEFHVRADGDRMPIAFAKLCKLMRKGRRMAVVYPDARNGSSFATMRIAGHDLAVGLGAATLAFHGKSTFHFARTRWTDTGVAVDFIPGPKVGPGDSRADVDAKMVRFYAENFTALLCDDPVDFGWPNLYWKTLMEAPP